MLTESDLCILTALCSPMSITKLSDRTEYSPSYVSERISHLEEFDLVATTQRNRTKEVRALHTPVLEAYRDLAVNNAHIDFPSLISPSMLQVCWFLDTPTAVSEIEPRLTLRRRRIYQLLEYLQSRTFIRKHGNRYVLAEDLKGLARFAQAAIKYEHQHHAEKQCSTAAILWSAPHEALITTRDEATETVLEAFKDRPHWYMTGLPRFADYDLTFFIPGAPPYFYSEIRDTLTAVDFIVHTLMLDTGTRRLSYCALLLLATDISHNELRATATYYGNEDTVDALITFVETKGETRHEGVRLPSWTEMTSLAEQYNVTI